MMKRAWFVVGAMFGIALVATCGTRSDAPPRDMIGVTNDMSGTMASDMTDSLRDMASAVSDLIGIDFGGVRDAAAAGPLTAVCPASASNYVWTSVAVPGLDPRTAPHVSVVMCDCVGAGCDLGNSGSGAPCALTADFTSVLLDKDKVFVRCGGNNWNFHNIYVRVD